MSSLSLTSGEEKPTKKKIFVQRVFFPLDLKVVVQYQTKVDALCHSQSGSD